MHSATDEVVDEIVSEPDFIRVFLLATVDDFLDVAPDYGAKTHRTRIGGRIKGATREIMSFELF